MELLAKALYQRNVRAAFACCPPEVIGDGKLAKIQKQGLDDWVITDRAFAKRCIPSLFYGAEVERDGISDSYNAVIFAELFKDKLSYSKGVWHHWSGVIWTVDSSRKRQALVPEIADFYSLIISDLSRLRGRISTPFLEARKEDVPVEIALRLSSIHATIERLSIASKKIRNIYGIRATLDLAQSRMSVPDDLWDSDPYLFTVQNGVVDLRTGEISPPRPERWMTRCAGGIYDPSAKAELFQKFLEQMQPDPEIRAYLQRLIGYCATGLASEQKLFTFHGNGANGKGTFVWVVTKALGTYAMKGPASLMVDQSPDRPRNDLAALAGARLVSISETSRNLRMDEAMIKTMTGQDELSVRFLNREFFQFVPCFTPILDTNHVLRPRDAGNAIWRRLITIPWPITISEEHQDKKLR